MVPQEVFLNTSFVCPLATRPGISVRACARIGDPLPPQKSKKTGGFKHGTSWYSPHAHTSSHGLNWWFKLQAASYRGHVAYPFSPSGKQRFFLTQACQHPDAGSKGFSIAKMSQKVTLNSRLSLGLNGSQGQHVGQKSGLRLEPTDTEFACLGDVQSLEISWTTRLFV